jgi:hypothetical protein
MPHHNLLSGDWHRLQSQSRRAQLRRSAGEEACGGKSSQCASVGVCLPTACLQEFKVKFKIDCTTEEKAMFRLRTAAAKTRESVSGKTAVLCTWYAVVQQHLQEFQR